MNRKARRAQAAQIRKHGFTITLPEPLSPEGLEELRQQAHDMGIHKVNFVIAPEDEA